MSHKDTNIITKTIKTGYSSEYLESGTRSKNFSTITNYESNHMVFLLSLIYSDGSESRPEVVLSRDTENVHRSGTGTECHGVKGVDISFPLFSWVTDNPPNSYQ